MGKHTKLKPATAATQPAELSNVDLAEQATRRAIETLQAALDDGNSSPAVTRELQSACRALVLIEAEKRAQTKAKQYTARNLPRELLLEALRLMPSDARAVIRREMDALDNTESVLG